MAAAAEAFPVVLRRRGANLSRRPHLPRSAKENVMAKSQAKSNREAKKPKKEVPKTIAAKPTTKGTPAKS